MFSDSPKTNQGQNIDGSKLMMNVRDLAALCDCSVRHIHRLVDAQMCPKPVRIGTLIRFAARTGDPATGILDWLEAGCPDCRKAAAK